MISLLKLTNLKQIVKKKITKFRSGDVVEITFFNRYLKHNFLHKFKGLCLKIKKNTINFSCTLRNVIKKIATEQRFIMHAPNIVDVKKFIRDSTKKKKNTKSKKYFIRKLPKPHSKFK